MRVVLFLFACVLVCATVCAEDMKVEIKDVKKQATLVIKAHVKQDEIGGKLSEILPKVFIYIGKNKIDPKSAMLTYYSKGDGKEFDIEGGVAVAEGSKGEGDVVASELPGGKTAFTVHTGTYDNLPKTYEALRAWLKAHGQKEKGVAWEIYISDPGSTKQDDLKTEIYMPVEEAK